MLEVVAARDLNEGFGVGQKCHCDLVVSRCVSVTCYMRYIFPPTKPRKYVRSRHVSLNGLRPTAVDANRHSVQERHNL